MTDIALDEKLAPCPFCGGEPKTRRFVEEYDADGESPAGEYDAQFFVCCDECGIEQREEYRADAIAAWNRRVSPSQVAPANPAQVTDAIRGIVEDALNSAIPEPWEVAEHATQRILAAIGAGGQAVGYVTKDALQNFDANGTEIVDVMLYPKGTLRPENEMAVYTCPAPAPVPDAVRTADQIVGQVEDRFPNWRSYRDLIDCIDCTLADLRRGAR